MQTRKKFLQTTTIALAGIPFATLMHCKKKGNGQNIDCTTGEDILGPFYRANAPFRTALNILNEAGTPILIRGQVLGGDDCSLPLAEAIVDVWHADDEGAYDNSTSDFKFRGRIETDEEGRYEFMSILPAPYDNGGQFRPRHIHYRVQAEGHDELITQLYFQGDEYIENDPWASRAEESRIVALTDDKMMEGEFDIFLKKSM